MPKRSRDLKVCCAVAAGITMGARLALRAPAQEGNAVAIAPLASSNNNYSPGISDIMKLVDAGVTKEVVKAYVENSPIAYNPTATEIVALNDHGVPADIIAAVLNRGGELRAKAARAGQAVATAVVPASTYGTEPVSSAYSYEYPAYTWPAYPSYSYWWYNYGSGWPLFYSPFVFYGGRFPFHHFHHRDFDFRGGVRFQNHGAAFRSAGFRARPISFPSRGAGLQPGSFGGRSFGRRR